MGLLARAHLSGGLFLKFILGGGLLLSLSLDLSVSFHHTEAFLSHHIWIHPGTKRHVNQATLKQRTKLLTYTPWGGGYYNIKRGGVSWYLVGLKKAVSDLLGSSATQGDAPGAFPVPFRVLKK